MHKVKLITFEEVSEIVGKDEKEILRLLDIKSDARFLPFPTPYSRNNQLYWEKREIYSWNTFTFRLELLAYDNHIKILAKEFFE